MGIFTRSHAFANLTPAERAFLKLLEGVLVAGLVAALPVASQALAQNGLNAAIVLPVAGGAFVHAVFAAILKYCKAFGDPALPTPTPAPVAVQAAVVSLPATSTPTADATQVLAQVQAAAQNLPQAA